MGLRDLLRKKDRLDEGETDAETVGRLNAPEFTFIRSDTMSQEVIHPPDNSTDEDHYLAPRDGRHGLFRSNRSRSASVSSQASTASKREGRRLSQRLHLSREPASSENVPADLPQIVTPADGQADKEGEESQWEQRATLLARENEKQRSRPSSPNPADRMANLSLGGRPGYRGHGRPPPQAVDEDIKEAIRLHEEGDLVQSTRMFGRLADPNGANNPLSQVLYGLALRHGWGCAPDLAAAVQYLSKAASNAAAVEQMALQAGMKKGGAAKGELVLAIFELANCFRHGWGVPKDAVAAKQYYETAANLGDADAMNEAGWCYVEGFGCKKDKFAAARYYRLAEKNGNKTLGNSWIWKDKYDPPDAGASGGKK